MLERTERRWWPWGRVLTLLLISIFGGLICWNRPVKPLWVAYEGQGASMIYGSSPDGEIACLESSTRLAVRDLRTGAILRAFDIPAVDRLNAVTTEDGNWVLLLTEKPELLVISLKDGSLRYPPIPIQSKSFPYLRDDGRYAIIPSGEMCELVDLSVGKVLWNTKSLINFCGNYQDLVIAVDPPSFETYRLMTIANQTDLGAIATPEMPGRKLVSITPFVDDRILLTYQIQMDLAPPDQKCLSARVSDRQLVDVRDEPLMFGCWESDDLHVTSTERGHLRQWASDFYSWQCTSFGEPVGPPIPLESSIAWPSKDGRYLVESGDRLAVFSIPPRSRWPETAAVVALPWLFVAVWQRLRARRAHSPSLAGSQPVQ